MATITIHVPGDGDTVAEYVEYVAGQLREGFTSGHVDAETHWDSESIDPDHDPNAVGG
jgi:hypothetical protein